MKEIEVKILDIFVEDIRQKLLQLGAKKIFQGEVKMVLLDFPDQRLKNEGCILRLRKLGEKVEFCWKGKKEKKQFKIREEIETHVESFETTLQILHALGLQKIYEGEKQRESYHLGTAKVEIDTWKSIPTFLEVEAPTEAEVQTCVEKLGFTMEQTTTMSAAEVEELYKKKKE